MNRRDFIDLIKVAEAILRLEEGCKILSGVGFDEGAGNDTFLVWEVLRRNAAEHYHYTDNLDVDIANYRKFSDIIQNKDMTPEEKYEALIA